MAKSKDSARNSFTGAYKINNLGQKEINVTLGAWSDVTGLTEGELKEWVRVKVLPTLPVFLEWRSATKDRPNKGGAVSRDVIVESMSTDLGLIRKEPADFIKSAELTTAAVWAHTAYIVRGHLQLIPACDKYFTNPEELKCGAFDYIKFLTKNMGSGRAFKKNKIAIAEAARAEFVEKTQWRAADYLDGKLTTTTSSSSGVKPSEPTIPLPVEQQPNPNADATKASSSTQEQSSSSKADGNDNEAETTVEESPPSSSANEIALQVQWTSSEGNDVADTRMRKPDCTLATFKKWAVEAFKMTSKSESLSGVSVVIGDLQDDDRFVDTEADWQSALRDARAALSEQNIIVVYCNSKLVPGARGHWMDADHFRDLHYHGHERSDVSADSSRKPNAYLLSHQRNLQQASALIKSVLGDTIDHMAVNKTPATKALAADLNYEATNPIDDQVDTFASVTPLSYDLVQGWLTTPKALFNDVARAKRSLRSQLGDNAEIIERLPPRRSEDPLRPGEQQVGDMHKAHQVCFLFWSLLVELKYGVVFCCDGCGTGKTHEFITHIIAATQFWTKRGQAPTKATLVVCPRTLLEKTYLDLEDQLGVDWEVYKYGQEAGVRKERLLFDPRHPVYTSANAGHTVVLATYSQLQHLKDGDQEREDRGQLFLRIILDEAQCIRRCDQTRQGAVLKSFNARFKAIFTGSPVVDSILDFDGYLAFLEFPFWKQFSDLNVSHGKEPERSRYAKFKAGIEDPVKRKRPDVRNDPTGMEDWNSDCDSVDGLSDKDIDVKIENDWQCTHWPALLKHNGKRPASLDRKDRKKINGRMMILDVPPPFEENPYGLYHPKNVDSIKCCSTTAFRHYIARHFRKSEMEELDMRIVAERMHKILDILVLSRNLFSKVIDEDGNETSIADELPSVSIHTQDLRMSADEAAAYKEREDECHRQFAEHFEAASLAKHATTKNDKTDQIKIGSKFAKLSVLCTHIGFSGLQHMSTAQIRAQRREGLPLLTARMKKAGALNPEDKDKPLDSDEEVLRQFVWGSPKMRFMLWEIQRVILGKTKPESHRKLMVTFQFPRSAEMFLKVVEFVGIRAVLLDINMSADERHRHIRAFDEKAMPQILITTYALNIAGHDAQHRCATVEHVEPASNWATEHQAASRVYRIGQKEEVEIIRLFTEGTYQELHESSMIKKADSMFAAFRHLHAASEAIADRDNMSSEDVARSAFGIFRKRVPDRNDRDVQSSKDEAVAKAKAKGKGKGKGKGAAAGGS